jgi:transcriptional regulator with XRE-family HTH domain
MGHLWDILQQHIDEQLYPPSYRQIAVKLGVQPQTLLNWRRPSALPSRANLKAIAELTRTPETDVLRAALIDTGYLEPDASDSSADRRTAG